MTSLAGYSEALLPFGQLKVSSTTDSRVAGKRFQCYAAVYEEKEEEHLQSHG